MATKLSKKDKKDLKKTIKNLKREIESGSLSAKEEKACKVTIKECKKKIKKSKKQKRQDAIGGTILTVGLIGGGMLAGKAIAKKKYKDSCENRGMGCGM